MKTGAQHTIVDVIKAVKTEQGAQTPEKFWADYARVSKEEAERISSDAGIKIDECYVHTFIGSSVIHVGREHGPGNEKRADQLPITESDFELLPEIIGTADEITTGVKKSSVGNETIVYLKERPEGDVLVVEEVRRGRKKLAFYTMRIAQPGYTYDLASPGHSIIKKGAKAPGVNVLNRHSTRS